MSSSIFQINFQKHFGGGEVYTHFLCNSLGLLGKEHTLIVDSEASFWDELSFNKTEIKKTTNELSEVLKILGDKPKVLITHGPINKDWVKEVKKVGHKLIAIVHMPLYGRNPKSYLGYDGLIGVSNYVIESLKDAGYTNVYPEPWYGVASLDRKQKADDKLISASRYDWDLRKGRDRIMSWLEPAYEKVRTKEEWRKKPGLTIGIVSRITPIKQFPDLFESLSKVLQEIPDINLEFFGSGGYASVRDLRKALGPNKSKARFWGFQKNVGKIYSELDFLLTGLPEKEALGLNVIEAQACNLPVLAVNAPPFTETVIHGKTGFLFEDPRLDNGKSFYELIMKIKNGQQSVPEPVAEKDHLSKFDLPTFTKRVDLAMDWIYS